MKSVIIELKRLHHAALMLAAMMAASSAYAAGTLSGTPVDNIASVDFFVGGIAQEVIRSSPTGNSVPGATGGTFTSFVVDNMVDLSVVQVDGAHVQTTPGATNAITAFDVTNEGNTPQGYALLVANLTAADPDVFSFADTGAQMVSFTTYVDDDGNGSFDGTEVVGNIDTLAPDTTVRVFVEAEAPIGVGSSDYANIRLTATTADAGTSGGTITAETTGGDTTSVDVVFADGPVGATYDGFEADDSGYTFSVADLVVTKTSALLSDPFNLTTNPKAIPGAVIEYTISLINNGTEDAEDVIVTDAIPGEVIALTGQYGTGADIEIQIEGTATSTFCTLAADGDGCTLSGTGASGEGGSLSINADTASGWTIAAADATDEVTILFQVEIL